MLHIDYNPQCWQDVETVLANDIDRLILYGPPGTGKTLGGLTMGVPQDNGNLAAFRLECTENMTEIDIIGGYLPNGEGGFFYKDGNAVKAWEGDGINGARLVADEIDKASGDILALLLAMFDSRESARWQHPVSGRIMRPRPGFSVVMTTNIMDPEELEPALKDRFPVAIHIDQPHPDAVGALPRTFQAVAVATVGEYSIRKWQDVAKLEKAVGINEALRLVIGGERAKQLADDFAIEAVA